MVLVSHIIVCKYEMLFKFRFSLDRFVQNSFIIKFYFYITFIIICTQGLHIYSALLFRKEGCLEYNKVKQTKNKD